MLIFTKVVGLLLTPPAVILLIALLGFLLRLRWPGVGGAIVALAFALLLVLSIPLTGYQLLSALEAGVRPLPILSPDAARRQADAIVVLGGGRIADAREYGGDTVSHFTLERLRYAARLHRATGLPILVSGGAPFGEKITEAELMRQALERDFQVRAKWLEDRSRTTYENAVYTKAMLAGAGARRVFVVTHAWHVPRALWAFADAGLDATMAPTLMTRYGAATVFDYLPSATGLALSSRAISERLGLWWYQARPALGKPAQADAGVNAR